MQLLTTVRGINPNTKDSDRNTALDLALKKQHFDIVVELLLHEKIVINKKTLEIIIANRKNVSQAILNKEQEYSRDLSKRDALIKLFFKIGIINDPTHQINIVENLRKCFFTPRHFSFLGARNFNTPSITSPNSQVFFLHQLALRLIRLQEINISCDDEAELKIKGSMPGKSSANTYPLDPKCDRTLFFKPIQEEEENFQLIELRSMKSKSGKK